MAQFFSHMMKKWIIVHIEQYLNAGRSESQAVSQFRQI